MRYVGSILDFYEALQSTGNEGTKAQVALLLRNWLNEVFDFDPRSGQVLTQGMDEFLCRTANFRKELSEFNVEIKKIEMHKDRVYRIVDHVDEAIFAILRQMRTKVIRKYPVMPLHAVREIDSKTMVWLSKKPGRNVREKLNGRPYLKAVKRRNSFDTSENRLFKSFVTYLNITLRERERFFSREEDELCNKVLTAVHNWLKSESALDIRPWKNLQPNNVLLNDLNYRKIWDAWLWSQRLDRLLGDDFKRLNNEFLFYLLISLISRLEETGQLRIVQQPLRIVNQDLNLVPISHFNGYLFDTLPSNRNTGTILILRPKGMYGYINTDQDSKIYFHVSYLSDSGIFEKLQVGDRVSFVSGSDKQGECAKKIDFILAKEPKEIEFTLEDDQLSIIIKRTKIAVYSELDGFSIQYGSGKKRQKLDYSITSFNKCIDVIYEKITGKAVGDFKYSSESTKAVPISSKYSIIDLYSIRPQFSVDGGTSKNLPFRLLMQYWLNGVDNSVPVDCSHSKAIRMHPDVQSISMRSLFLNKEKCSQAFISEAVLFLIGKIRAHIVAESLYYLIPDWINDFELKNIRKQINYLYDYSSPIPKSIAAVIEWQSSAKFDVDKLRENDFVLVIDIVDGGVSITPVKGVYSGELERRIPKTGGYFWERHPTELFPVKEFANFLSGKLLQDGCPSPTELFNLFGFDGLVGDVGALSIVKEATWYHLHMNRQELLPNYSEIESFIREIINQSMAGIAEHNENAAVFLLPLDSLIRKVKTRKQLHWIDSSLSTINGAEKLLLWQKEAGDLVLWKDHLPNLAFDNIPQQFTKKFFWWGKFYLVKDNTLVPRQGKQEVIPVKEFFTLPAGQAYYTFPLLQGEGNNELQFVAYLKSPAFPLQENVTCKLHMTYTYGVDDPYELRFIPLNTETAGFKSVNVEWRSADSLPPVDLSSLPMPSFPSRKTWADFKRFPKKTNEKDKEDYSDLLKWCTSKLGILSKITSTNIDNEVSKYKSKRQSGIFLGGKEDKNGEYFCRVRVNGDSVFCHSSYFIEEITEGEIKKCEKVYLDVRRDNRGFYGMFVSFREKLPESLNKTYRELAEKIVEELNDDAELGIRILRFPVLTIWNNGHSLSDSDIPHGFKTSVRNGIQAALTILKSENYPDSLKNELFFFLSCLHKDAPGYVQARLVEMSNDREMFISNYRSIAFAIGNAETSWQKELLDNVISKLRTDLVSLSKALEILAVVFWRSEKLIFKLTKSQVITLSEELIECLNYDAEKVILDGAWYRVLSKHLELLLALLRSRDSENGMIQDIFSPDKSIVKQFISLLDRIVTVLTANDIELKSRISLHIEKPEIFHNVPDLLYALRMYLTGDSEANTIIITGITDEE